MIQQMVQQMTPQACQSGHSEARCTAIIMLPSSMCVLVDGALLLL